MQPSLSGQQFEIGLAMAGAISAGSYSGGVFDFLMQALDEWEKARSDDALGNQIPNHRVGIKVIAGASAGAVTGGIGTIALAGGLRPQNFSTAPAAGNPSTQQIKYVLPSLYQAWVVAPCMVSPVGGKDLLSRDDLRKDQPVPSLLDSSLLQTIRDNALQIAAPTQPPAPYIAETLHVYMTLTNLRGVPYAISMRGGDYGLMSHGDRRHFLVQGCGAWTTASPSQFTTLDPGQRLHRGRLFGPQGAGSEWIDFGTASLASAAFPLGLAPVKQQVDAMDYQQRQWPLPSLQQAGQAPLVMPSPSSGFPGAEPDGCYTFYSIDGGVIDNEPFEYAHFALMKTNSEPNKRKGDEADRAVIMIDPFPEAPDFPAPGLPAGTLLSVVKALFPVLKTQARFKPAELILAGAENVFSRFLVAPHRTLPGANREEPYAIACGLLGGFGGFLSQRFRDHDFQLGRRNCQRFLQESFTLPANNPIIKAWPASALANPAFSVQLPPAQPGQPGQTEYCIIPLLGTAKAEVALQPWPRLTASEFEGMQPRIRERFDAVCAGLSEELAFQARWKKLALSLVLKISKGSILGFIRDMILADLVRRDQLEGWQIPAPWKKPLTPLPDPAAVHAVWAQLLNPAFDYFTEVGIASATKLPPERVHDILLMSQAEDGRAYAVWSPSWKSPGGQALYCLASRKPGLLGRLPVTRQVGDWFSTPSIN